MNPLDLAFKIERCLDDFPLREYPALHREFLQQVATALRAALEQAEPVVEPEQPNLWRDAVDGELASLQMVASDDPQESIRRLIDWHCAVQIDPLVSSAAQELIERGKREALEQPVTLAVVRSAVAIVASWSARTKALRDFEPADRFAIGEAIDTLRAGLKRAGLVAVPANVVAFLRGTAPLNGCNFGEKPENERGEFWWRKHLPTSAISQQAEPAVWDPQCPLCGGSRPAAPAQQAEPVADADGNASY
jgi:hypothetical protein